MGLFFPGRTIFIKILFYFIIVILLISAISTNTFSQNEKKLKVGVSLYSPPAFFTEEDPYSIQGISVDIAKTIADNIGRSIQFYTIDDIDYIVTEEDGGENILTITYSDGVNEVSQDVTVEVNRPPVFLV